MKNWLNILLVTPLVILGVFFCIANREPVILVLNPFVDEARAFALSLPLFLALFLFLGIGVAIGSVTMWINQRHYRHMARQAESELEHLREESQKYRLLAQQETHR